MAAITYTSYGQINENIKCKVITASVTAADNTITIEDMSNIRGGVAYVSGTPQTLKAFTTSTNVITTTGWSSSTETWIIIVFGN